MSDITSFLDNPLSFIIIYKNTVYFRSIGSYDNRLDPTHINAAKDYIQEYQKKYDIFNFKSYFTTNNSILTIKINNIILGEFSSCKDIKLECDMMLSNLYHSKDQLKKISFEHKFNIESSVQDLIKAFYLNSDKTTLFFQEIIKESV